MSVTETIEARVESCVTLWFVVIRGLPGSGKSTLAAEVQKTMGEQCEILDPDLINYGSQEYLMFVAELEEVDPKFYPYRFLLNRAGEALNNGKNVLWCQAWTRLDGIKRAMGTISNRVPNVNLAVVELKVPDGELGKRLEDRQNVGGNKLDRRPLEEFMEAHERWSDRELERETVYLELNGMAEVGILANALIRSIFSHPDERK